MYSAHEEALGTVEKVVRTRIHVRPYATLSQHSRQNPGWQDDGAVYELDPSAVDRIDGDEIHPTEPVRSEGGRHGSR